MRSALTLTARQINVIRDVARDPSQPARDARNIVMAKGKQAFEAYVAAAALALTWDALPPGAQVSWQEAAEAVDAALAGGANAPW